MHGVCQRNNDSRYSMQHFTAFTPQTLFHCTILVYSFPTLVLTFNPPRYSPGGFSLGS